MKKLKILLLFLIGIVILIGLPVADIWLDISEEFVWLYFVWYSIVALTIIFFLVIRFLRRKKFVPEPELKITPDQALKICENRIITDPMIADHIKSYKMRTINIGRKKINQVCYIVFEGHYEPRFYHFFINLNEPSLFHFADEQMDKILSDEKIKEYADSLSLEKEQKPKVYEKFHPETGQVTERVVTDKSEEEIAEEEKQKQEEEVREI